MSFLFIFIRDIRVTDPVILVFYLFCNCNFKFFKSKFLKKVLSSIRIKLNREIFSSRELLVTASHALYENWCFMLFEHAIRR